MLNTFTYFIINLCFYINIASAMFYLILYLTKSKSTDDELKMFDGVWHEFSDIMKFKVAATIHAIAFKFYVDSINLMGKHL